MQQLHPDRHHHRHGHRLQGHHRHLRHQLQLPGTRDRRRRKPQHLLQHGLGRDARHHRSVTAGNAQRDRGLKRRDRPLLGRVHRQRRRQRLPHRALRWVGVQQLHPDRHHHRHGHRLQGHHRQLRHQLQLPGTRDRRRRKPQHLLQHGRRDDAHVGFHPALAAGNAWRDGGVGR